MGCSKLVYRYGLLRSVVDRFEKAKASREPKLYVTDVSSRLSRDRGRGYEAGVKLSLIHI